MIPMRFVYFPSFKHYFVFIRHFYWPFLLFLLAVLLGFLSFAFPEHVENEWAFFVLFFCCSQLTILFSLLLTGKQYEVMTGFPVARQFSRWNTYRKIFSWITAKCLYSRKVIFSDDVILHSNGFPGPDLIENLSYSGFK